MIIEFQIANKVSFILPISGEQTVRAALELGIIVGVALMVGLGFMAMVGMEILVDKIIDEYRFGMLNNPVSQLLAEYPIILTFS